MAKKSELSREKRIDQLIAECNQAFDQWKALYEHGGRDPTWPDGVNLNLVRDHIMGFQRRLRELCDACELPETAKRELPPKVESEYMARADEIRNRAAATFCAFQEFEDYRELRALSKGISEKDLEKHSVNAVLGYVKKLKTAIQADDLVAMRRYENGDFYFKAITEALAKVRELPFEGYQLTFFETA